MMADLLRLANVPNLTSCGLLKKMERFAIRTVITDSSIPPDPLHVTFLTLSGVPEGSIWLHAVMVAVLFASVTGEQENERFCLRCADATLTLPTELVV
jgi:hypothetical protein